MVGIFPTLRTITAVDLPLSPVDIALQQERSMVVRFMATGPLQLPMEQRAMCGIENSTWAIPTLAELPTAMCKATPSDVSKINDQ